jgi:ferritin-like metal-binding protein YciE
VARRSIESKSELKSLPLWPQGLKTHLEETNKQIERLDQVFKKLGQKPSGTDCPAIDGHTKTSTELKTLVSSGKVKTELPTALDSSHQSKLDKLKGSHLRDIGRPMSGRRRDIPPPFWS